MIPMYRSAAKIKAVCSVLERFGNRGSAFGHSNTTSSSLIVLVMLDTVAAALLSIALCSMLLNFLMGATSRKIEDRINMLVFIYEYIYI